MTSGTLQFSLILVLLTFVVQMMSAEKQTNPDVEHQFVTATLSEGQRIRGRTKYTIYKNHSFVEFLGVPYAEVPIGRLRFKPPVAKVMPAILDALAYSVMCTQTIKLETTLPDGEDCLYLNIFTPALSPPRKLDVIVLIPAGAYNGGGNNDQYYGAEFMMEKNVVLVTINYRLGVFGFMSLGSTEYSGNMGLKDQRLALRWVQTNIAQFGGDPNRVTAMGHSAGSTSLHLHMLSGTANNLFHRSILMSGTAATVWATSATRNHRRRMMAFAQKHNSSISTYAELVDFLIKAPLTLFRSSYNRIENSDKDEQHWQYVWSPVVQDDTVDDPFVVHASALTSEYVTNWDVLIGHASDERLGALGPVLSNPDSMRKIDQHFQIAMPFLEWNICWEKMVLLTQKTEQSQEKQAIIYDLYQRVMSEVRQYYFGNATIGQSTATRLISMLSDIHYIYPISQTLNHQLAHSSGRTYYYQTSPNTMLNTVKRYMNLTAYDGATHGDEMCYFFKCFKHYYHLYELTADSIERRVQETMLNLWTNFAKHGTPTPGGSPLDFTPITVTDWHLVNIDNSGLKVLEHPYQRTRQFWDKLYHKYSANITLHC